MTVVVLSDVVFFLQESNQKFHFVTQDNKVLCSTIRIPQFLIPLTNDILNLSGWSHFPAKATGEREGRRARHAEHLPHQFESGRAGNVRAPVSDAS